MNWLFANWVNILLILMLCLIVGGIILSMIRRKKQGSPCCGCSCGCSGSCCGDPEVGEGGCSDCHN